MMEEDTQSDASIENESPIFYEMLIYSEWRQDPDFWMHLLRPCRYLEKTTARVGWFDYIRNEWPMKELLIYWSLQLPWLICVCPNGQYVAIFQDVYLEIRSTRRNFTTVMGKAAVFKDALPQCRKMAWSPDGVLVAVCSSRGLVCVYDMFAFHLFTIPKPEDGSTRRYVVGLEFVNSPIKVPDWGQAIMVIYSDGMLNLYYVSSKEGKYILGHAVNLPVNGGVSAATFCPRLNMLFLATKPTPFKVFAKETSVTAGISGWKIINQHPFYEVVFPTEEEVKVVTSSDFLWKILLFTRRLTCVAKMRISPSGIWLATFHCSGAVRIWQLPGLRLHRRWGPNYMSNVNLIVPQVEPKEKEAIPVDVEWRTDYTLVVTWDNGEISVHDVDTFEVFYGSGTELLHGTPRISSSHPRIGYVALECEFIFISACGKEHVVEDDDEEEKIVYNATSEYIQSAMEIFANPDKFIPNRKPNQLALRIYRLIGIKSISIDERYLLYLKYCEYEKAFEFAQKYGLDESKVYESQWTMNTVSSYTITNYLEKVIDKAWVLHECITRVPESLDGVYELQNYGIEITEFDKIFDGLIETEENVRSITIETLTDIQKLMIKTRLALLRFSAKLDIYERILKLEGNKYEKYDMESYAELRKKHIVEIAIFYARSGNPLAVETILDEYPSVVVPHILTVLSNFPETLNPNKYSNILPQCNSEGTLVEWPEERSRRKDWAENDKFKFLLDKECLPEIYNRATPLTEVVLSEWYKVRALEIENFCGIIRNAVELLELGKKHNIQGLEPMYSDILTAEVLVYKLQIPVDLIQFLYLSPIEKALKLVEKSTESTIVIDIYYYFLPFLKRYKYVEKEERFNLFSEFIKRISSDNINMALKFFEYVLNGNLDVLGTVDEFITMICDCMHSYNGFDRLEDSLSLVHKVIVWLNKFADFENKRGLLEQIYMLRDELVSIGLLLKYRVKKTFSTMHSIKINDDEIIVIISKMTNDVLEHPLKERSDLQALLKDILLLQQICFKTFPMSRCYELFVGSVLCAESVDLIEYAAKFICSRQEDEVRKPISYDKSVELILNSARLFFNYSRDHQDRPMTFAKLCLSIIKEEEPEIMKELDLIQAVRILIELGVNMLPVMVRNVENKMKLIEIVFKKNANAYKQVQTIYKLASKLWICDKDTIKRYSMITVRLAEEAFLKENFKLCAELCSDIIIHECIDGWQICLKLGTNDDYKCLNHKLTLIEFAFIHSPIFLCKQINETKKILTKKILYEKVKSCFQPILLDEDDNNEETSDENIFKVIEKILRKLFEDSSRFNHNSQKSATTDSIILQEELVKQYSKNYNTEFMLDVIQCLIMNPSAQSISDLNLIDQVLLECTRLFIFEDPPLGLSFLFSVNSVQLSEKFFTSISNNPISYQIAMYFYALVGSDLLEKREFVHRSPQGVLQLALQHNYNLYNKILNKYTVQNDEHLQAEAVSALNCGVDIERFISDMDYRKDTVFGISMSIELEKILVAIELAEKNHLPKQEMIFLHLESFLREYGVPLEKLQTSLQHPVIVKLLREDPQFFKNRLMSVFESLNGCDYQKILIFFTILQTIDETAVIYSLIPKQHLKLIKKVKATSSAINYIDFITLRQDFIQVLKPALTNENFNNVIKLIKSLPEQIKNNFRINTLYRIRAVEEFFVKIKLETTMKQCLNNVKNIFNIWLNRVELSDMKIFIEKTLWSRECSLILDYDLRKQILLDFVAWISLKKDFSENIGYFMSLIQERLTVMDRIWNNDLDIPLSDSLKNYLFDLEELLDDEYEINKIMKKLLLDDNMNEEEILIAHKSSGLNEPVNLIISTVLNDHETKNRITSSRLSFLQQLLNDTDQEVNVTEESSNNSHLKMWPDNLIENIENLPPNIYLERLLSETNCVEQITALHTMILEATSTTSLLDIHLLQTELLKKLVTIKGHDKFTLVAKIMDEASLNKKEIIELVNNHKSNGDILVLVWICIQSNLPELEDLAKTFLEDIEMDQMKTLVYRIKTLPWDVIKIMASTSIYPKLFEFILMLEDEGSAAEEMMSVLKEIQLMVEAATFNMRLTNVAESLISFHTALNLSEYE